jgi:hypothetical protein
MEPELAAAWLSLRRESVLAEAARPGEASPVSDNAEAEETTDAVWTTLRQADASGWGTRRLAMAPNDLLATSEPSVWTPDRPRGWGLRAETCVNGRPAP